MIVFNASILIALLDDDNVHHNWTLQMFIDTVSKDPSMSVLNFAQALIHAAKAGRSEQFLKIPWGLGSQSTAWTQTTLCH